jgi:hypothetical protein
LRNEYQMQRVQGEIFCKCVALKRAGLEFESFEDEKRKVGGVSQFKFNRQIRRGCVLASSEHRQRP